LRLIRRPAFLQSDFDLTNLIWKSSHLLTQLRLKLMKKNHLCGAENDCSYVCRRTVWDSQYGDVPSVKQHTMRDVAEAIITF
jgi:hypothetical protein